MLKRIEIIGLFLALGAIPALAGAAREEHTRTFQKTVPLASEQRLEIENKFGDVSVVDSNASVRAADITGSLDLRNPFGVVLVRKVSGTVTIGNAIGGVELTEAGGAVEVENSNGAVVVDGVPAKPCSPIVLKTSFSPLKVYLPEDAGYNLTAKTSFGRINSELGVTASGGMGGDSLTGRIGGGGCELRLTTSNGGIEILKAVKR